MSLEGLHIGHYQLLRLVGRGAMGEIYLAQDKHIERQVAIKIIHSDLTPTQHKQMQRFFQREGRAIAMLDHPHILPLFDYGETLLKKLRFTYLVMPYHPEGSLDNWLTRHFPTGLPTFKFVEQIVRQAADALQYAHERGIVHQDVKEANFLVRSNRVTPDVPHLLLADFGLAKLRSSTTTTNRQGRGTPFYMAPEQWRGETVPASDQYALAVMAYHLLTGKYPFEGDMYTVMYHHLNTKPDLLSSINPQLTTRLDDVLLRALAKDAQARFPTIASFAQALQQAFASMPTSQASVKKKHAATRRLGLFTVPLREAASSQQPSIIKTTMFHVKHSPEAERPDVKKQRMGRKLRGRMLWQLVVVLVLLIGTVGALLFNIFPLREMQDAGPEIQPQHNETTIKGHGQQPDDPVIASMNTATVTETATSVSPTAQVSEPGGSSEQGTATAINVPIIGPLLTAVPLFPSNSNDGNGGTALNSPLQVQEIKISLSPPSIGGTCGSIVTQKYTATIMVNANSGGGIVSFKYSVDNGQSYIPGSLIFNAGETSKDFVFSKDIQLSGSETLAADTPDTAIVTTISPNVVTAKETPQMLCVSG